MLTGPTEVDGVASLPDVITSYREDVTDPIKWKVVDTHGDMGVGIDFASSVMAVPLNGDDHSRRIKLQQEVRARISPTDDSVYATISGAYGGYSEDLLRAVEKARVNAVAEQFAKVKGLVHEPDGSEKIRGRRLATAGDERSWDSAVEFTLNTFGTKSFDSFCSGIRSVNDDWSKRLRNLEKRLKASFDETPAELGSTEPMTLCDGDAKVTQGFRHTLYASGVVSEYLSNGYRAPKSIQEARAAKEEKAASEYGKRTDEKGALDSRKSELDTDDVPDGFEFPTDEDSFAPLIWDDSLKRTVEVAGYLHRKRKAVQYGRRVAYPSRLLTDPERRVFGRKTKVKGGIVVVDISGSMHLTDEDLNDIVEAAPASVVMAYSQGLREDGVPNAWLLADRGWRVKTIGGIGGRGNGVDGTALTWAIRHRKHGEQIVWISDGQVTTGRELQPASAVIMCAKLVKKHRIIMIPSVAEAVSMFKANKLINKPAGPIREALLGKF